MAVLDRIEVDIVDVVLEVAVVADGVFPEPVLPDFLIRRDHDGRAQAAREAGFQKSEACRFSLDMSAGDFDNNATL